MPELKLPDRVIDLTAHLYTVGRQEGCHIPTDNSRSRRHTFPPSHGGKQRAEGNLGRRVLINDDRVSRLHCTLVRFSTAPVQYWLVDGDKEGYKKSRNGIKINGRKVIDGQLLEHGDVIQIGKTKFVYYAPPQKADLGKLTQWKN